MLALVPQKHESWALQNRSSSPHISELELVNRATATDGTGLGLVVFPPPPPLSVVCVKMLH